MKKSRYGRIRKLADKKYLWNFLKWILVSYLSVVFVNRVYKSSVVEESEPFDSSSRTGQVLPLKNIDEIQELPESLISLKSVPAMYCSIPKTNCRTLKKLIRKREGFSDWDDSSKIHSNNGLSFLSRDRSLNYSINLLKDKNIFKFIVVRNPFARLISAYENKINSPTLDHRLTFRRKLVQECPGILGDYKEDSESFISFSKFVRCITSVDDPKENEDHWRSQTSLCGLDYIEYNQVLAVESFSEDILQLLYKLGWRKERKLFQLWRKPVLRKRIAEYYKSEDIRLVLDHYKDDFRILGYPTTPSGSIGFYSNSGHLQERYNIKKFSLRRMYATNLLLI